MNRYYHCKTQEEYDWLMEMLKENGYRWKDKSFPTEDKAFKCFEGDTIVEANGEDKRLVYADVEYYLVEEGKEPSDFILVSYLMKEEKEKPLPQVVYLVQKTPLINKGVKTTDGVFRTFQAAEKHILDQGGGPLGFFCYESTELGFEIEQFEVLEVEE